MNPYGPPGYGPPGPAPTGWPVPPVGPHAYPGASEDEQHLDILGICHFVYGGLVGLVGLGGLVYVALGLAFATAVVSGAGSSGAAPAAALGGLFAVFGGFFTLLLWAKAACLIVSGIGLRKRRRPTFSFVLACLCCIQLPLGTMLGVFTLVVLSRPSVKALYARVAQST